MRSGATTTTAYTYNAYDQLVSSSVFSGHPSPDAGSGFIPLSTTEPIQQHTEYEIGVAGNVSKETVTRGENSTVREFETNTLGQTTSIITNGIRVEQRYDSAGNLIRAADGTEYTYNALNQPVTELEPNGVKTTHNYWATGQRRSFITEANTSTRDTTEMYWDGSHLINDIYVTDTTQHVASYLLGISRHARTVTTASLLASSPSPVSPPAGPTDVLSVEPTLASTAPPAGTPTPANTAPPHDETINYYISDRHGNTTATTNTEGDITASYTYSDYGTPTENIAPQTNNTVATTASRNPFLYAGEYSTHNGKQYLAARTYNPTVFGFTTQDIADQFDLYAYTHSNPITFIDPTGQKRDLDLIAHGLLLGASTLAIIVSACVLTLPSATWITAWAPWAVGVTGLASDIGTIGLEIAQLIIHETKHLITDTKKAFQVDQVSKTLESAVIGLALAGTLGALGAAYSKVVAEEWSHWDGFFGNTDPLDPIAKKEILALDITPRTLTSSTTQGERLTYRSIGTRKTWVLHIDSKTDGKIYYRNKCGGDFIPDVLDQTTVTLDLTQLNVAKYEYVDGVYKHRDPSWNKTGWNHRFGNSSHDIDITAARWNGVDSTEWKKVSEARGYDASYYIHGSRGDKNYERVLILHNTTQLKF